jgi:hypothetical protein
MNHERSSIGMPFRKLCERPTEAELWDAASNPAPTARDPGLKCRRSVAAEIAR